MIQYTKIEEPLDRSNNSVSSLHKRYKEKKPLAAGQLVKICHLLSSSDQKKAKSEIKKKQEKFWEKWTGFRCGLSKEKHPTFESLIELLPVRRQFTRFLEIANGDLAIDLMGGSAIMAGYIVKKHHFFNFLGLNKIKLAGYVNIDSNSRVFDRAKKHLKDLQINKYYLIEHDLKKGVPQELKNIINKTKPKRLIFFSNWGVTYLTANDFDNLTKQCLIFGQKMNLPTHYAFNMITDGKFNPKILRKKFSKEIIPSALLGFKIRKIYKALFSLKKMMKFAADFQQVFPLWYPEELISIIQDAGLDIMKIDNSLLWGQSTAMQVSLKEKNL